MSTLHVKLAGTPDGGVTLHVTAHYATFRKWWKEVCQDWMTCSAAKYCKEPRRADGVYIIEPMTPDVSDAIREIKDLCG